MMHRLIAPIAVVALGLAACASLERSLSGGRDSKSTADKSAESKTNTDCRMPQVTVDYLPWLSDGETVALPKSHSAPGESQLVWLPQGKPGWAKAHVVLYHLSGESPGPATQAVGVKYQGSPAFEAASGYLAEGEGAKDENIADVSIVWLGDGDRCNMAVLTLNAPNLTLEQGKTEIVRIAKSMAPSPS